MVTVDVSSSRFKAGRVGSTAATIFAEMSALAVATDSVNLGQGFPDYDGPDFMLAAAERAIAEGVNQYPPGRGIAPLRRAVVDHSRRHYGLDYDADTEVVITTGATEALAAAILAFVDPGDEVIALEPFYDSYAASVALAGGPDRRRRGVRAGLRPRPGRAAGGRHPAHQDDLGQLTAQPDRRGARPRPSWPRSPSSRSQHDLLVVCDEVYEHLVFDDAEHLPLATFPGMRERTIRISSSGKTFSATGWKIGWALGPAQLITELTAVKQFLTYVSGAPFQPAIARALDEGDAWVAAARDELQGKRDRLAAGLRSVGLEPAIPRGTYFMTTDVRPARLRRRGRVLPRPAASLRGGGHPPPGVLRAGRAPAARTSAGRSASPTRCSTRPSAGSSGLAERLAEPVTARRVGRRYHWVAPGVHRIRQTMPMYVAIGSHHRMSFRSHHADQASAATPVRVSASRAHARGARTTKPRKNASVGKPYSGRARPSIIRRWKRRRMW